MLNSRNVNIVLRFCRLFELLLLIPFRIGDLQVKLCARLLRRFGKVVRRFLVEGMIQVSVLVEAASVQRRCKSRAEAVDKQRSLNLSGVRVRRLVCV